MLSPDEGDTKGGPPTTTYHVGLTRWMWVGVVGTILVLVGLALLFTLARGVLSPDPASDALGEVTTTPIPEIDIAATSSPVEVVDTDGSCQHCPSD